MEKYAEKKGKSTWKKKYMEKKYAEKYMEKQNRKNGIHLNSVEQWE